MGKYPNEMDDWMENPYVVCCDITMTCELWSWYSFDCLFLVY